MNDRSKQHARLGLFYLREAVLELLLEVDTRNEGPLKNAEIRDRLGLPDEHSGPHQHLFKGVLYHLLNDGYVIKSSPANAPEKWVISPEGRQLFEQE